MLLIICDGNLRCHSNVEAANSAATDQKVHMKSVNKVCTYRRYRCHVIIQFSSVQFVTPSVAVGWLLQRHRTRRHYNSQLDWLWRRWLACAGRRLLEPRVAEFCDRCVCCSVIRSVVRLFSSSRAGQLLTNALTDVDIEHGRHGQGVTLWKWLVRIRMLI